MTQATIHTEEGLQSQPLLSPLNPEGFNQHSALMEIPRCVFSDSAGLLVPHRDSKAGREQDISSTVSAQTAAPLLLSPKHSSDQQAAQHLHIFHTPPMSHILPDLIGALITGAPAQPQLPFLPLTLLVLQGKELLCCMLCHCRSSSTIL